MSVTVTDPVIVLGLGLLLSWLCLDAGAQKLRDPSFTAITIDDYRLLPEGAGKWLAHPLAIFELCLGVLILLPLSRVPALIGAAVLLLVYGTAMTVNVLRGRRDIDCGCAGPGQGQRLGVPLILRNALLAVAGLVAASASAEPAHWSGWLFGFLCAVVAALLYASINALLANHQRLERLR